ncbi:MAG: hypothetical protein U0Q15_00065 [Kineosporiaceae bacterium]
MKLRTSSPRRRLGLAAVPLAMLASAGLVYQASQAAFTASTSTDTNNWTAGSVALTNSSSGSALFNISGLGGGATDTKCVTVTYNGDLTAGVKLYATSVSGTGLDQYLDLTIEEGTGGNAACVGFTPVRTLHTGTLKSFTDAATSFNTGLTPAWAVTGAGQTNVYRFTWTLQNNNSAMGKNAHAAFTWEAQNS